MNHPVAWMAPLTPNTELEDRVARCRRAMKEHGINALVLTSQANYVYFSGWRGPSWDYTARPTFAVLSDAGLVLIVNPFEDLDIKKRPRHFTTAIYNGFQTDLIAMTVKVINDLKLGDNAKVGVDYCQDMFGRGSLELIDELRNAAHVAVVPADAAIWPVRKIKSAFEIEMKRKAFEMMNEAFDEAVAQAHEGMTKMELLCDIKCRLLQKGAESVDHILVHVYGKSPDDVDTDTVIREGDYFWTDVFSTFGGYPADRCRIARCGAPSPQEEKCYEDVHGLTIDLCKSLKPGMKGKEVYALFEAICRERDIGPFYTSLSRIGHDSGVEVTEPNFSIASTSEDVLEAGMIVHIEPKLFKHGGVFQFEEVAYVTENGAQFLSALAPQKLPVIAVDR